MSDKPEPDHDRRTRDEVWSAIGSLDKRLGQVEISLDSISKTLGTIGNRLDTWIREDNERERDGKKMPWPLFGLLLVFAGMVGGLLHQQFISLEKQFSREDGHIADAIERVENVNPNSISYQFGKLHSDLETLESKLDGAIGNRHDNDRKHEQGIASLSERIHTLKDEVNHYFDNGAGQRIEEKMAPLVERVLSLERSQYGTVPDRDMDRQ